MSAVPVPHTPVCHPTNGVGGTAEIFRTRAETVSRWVRALAGPGADVEDLTQEVFAVVHRKLGGFRGDSSLDTWLFGITSNLVRRHRRVQGLRRWLKGSAEETAGHLASTESLASEVLGREEARRSVYHVLNQMNDRYREALILFELEGRPAAEIAEYYDVKPSAVFVWLHRARADFLKRLQRLEQSEGEL